MQFDFLIIGSGIAGLSYALKIAEFGSVGILTKTFSDETNTKYAQGGIASVVNEEDSFEKHIQDTLIAGDGLCDEKIVKIVIKEGPDRIKELIHWGTSFDKDEKGDFDLAKEGGHSDNRILHFQDATGAEIERALLNQIKANKNITLLEHYFALDLITQHHFGEFITKSSQDIECYGIYGFDINTNIVEAIRAKIVVLATGGAGQAYANTTNPAIATGDGIAMAYRAKAKVENMEFYQFHPTAFYNPGESPCFLLSEALRGEGAVLRNHEGVEFMEKYDVRSSLAPRNVVSQAMDSELKKSGKSFLFLDCRNIELDVMENHFPNILNYLLKAGFDMRKEQIPCVPAAHYCCGGIKVNEHGQTSIRNLYACGECSSSGLHGANRLASNSLLEAVVFSERIYQHSKNVINSISFKSEIKVWDASKTSSPEELILISGVKKEVQVVMSRYVGIVRSDMRLERAMKRLSLLYEETESFYQKTSIGLDLCELRNLITVSYLIIKSAMRRKESRGLHYNVDWPSKLETKIEPTVF